MSSVHAEVMEIKETQSRYQATHRQSPKDFAGQSDAWNNAALDQRAHDTQDLNPGKGLTVKVSPMALEYQAVVPATVGESYWQLQPICCNCSCHRRRCKRSARSMEKVTGAVFTAYSGIPKTTPKCENFSCMQLCNVSNFWLSFTYFFPVWFLSWAIAFVIKKSRIGFDYNFRVFHCVSYSSPIFQCAYQGDVAGLKILLQTRSGSPFDVTGEPQRSLLSVR